MQLIPISILIFTALLLLNALHFVIAWHKARQNENITSLLHNTIFHYGITLVSAYPTTLRPLLSMLEEQYPRSEAMLICDLHNNKQIGDILHRFRLVRVNHDHLEGVRSLYRSRLSSRRGYRPSVGGKREKRGYCPRSRLVWLYSLHGGRYIHRTKHSNRRYEYRCYLSSLHPTIPR